MKEIACNFGPNKSLFGILTMPDDDVRVSGAPISLILNAGIVHRVGPFRIHVDIARQLAQRGFATLRLDLSGLGDSAARTGKIEIEDRALLDVSDAMEFLEQETGVNRFTLLGLCSGAYNAHRIAVKDERIVGSVFMDGIVFRTAGYRIRRFLRFFNPRFWRNTIKRRFIKNSNEVDSKSSELGETEFFDVGMDRDAVVEELNLLRKRHCLLYTSDAADE